MVFKRRKRLPIARKIREGLFPEKGWSRAAEYMMARIKRLPDSPKNISFGVAIGVFVSFSPFFGVHVLLAFLLLYFNKLTLTKFSTNEFHKLFFLEHYFLTCLN